jgi:histidine triad (HIT) family protein
VIGLEVPHAHVHLIPIDTMADVSFQNKTSLNPDEMKALAAQISSAVAELS